MNIHQMIQDLKNLPPAPRVMPKLLNMLNDPNASSDDITALIQLDPGLTAKIIGTSNSVYYGGVGDIKDLNEAVCRLGFREIYRIVTNIYAKSFVGQKADTYLMDSEERWQNSVANGLVMELVSQRRVISDPATAYTVGLLHDIGKTVIHELFADTYQRVYDLLDKVDMPVRDAEQHILGVDFALAGAALLEAWDFPEEIVDPIRHQFEFEKSENSKLLAALLHVSKWVVAGIGGAPGKHARAFEMNPLALEILGLNEMESMALMIDAKDLLKKKEDMLVL
jgi:HD-like signal output (HDOD) protein